MAARFYLRTYYLAEVQGVSTDVSFLQIQIKCQPRLLSPLLCASEPAAQGDEDLAVAAVAH
jgi:hypothetical protein